jgi:hypothetical protein
MTNKGHTITQEIKIQGLIDRYLHFRSANTSFSDQENHLDEDSLTAFVEGKLGEHESPTIIKHLIDCSFCLHVTGDLAKLNAVFAEDEAIIPIAAKEPTKISEVLNGLLSRFFGTSDNAVFAHQEKEEDKPDEHEQEDSNKQL